MAETKLHNYSVQEKLNKMDVDLLEDVIPTVDTNAHAAQDLLWNPIIIKNAVSVPGGTALLQSVAAANADALTGSFDIVFTTSNDEPGGLNADITGTTGLSDTNAAKILGITTINRMQDVGGASVGSKANIGLVIKAEAGSKDIYCYGIAQSTDDPSTATGYTLRFGVVKD